MAKLIGNLSGELEKNLTRSTALKAASCFAVACGMKIVRGRVSEKDSLQERTSRPFARRPEMH